ncbi:MAG TPA: GTP-binding protein, partial [Candidatus Hypogeohydataceae bacterium YC40]
MAVAQTKDIRNVAVVGHGASGKTSLLEAILFRTGASSRMGSVDESTSIADYEPEERERKFTISAKLLPCQWQGRTINALDTPGYPDFISHTIGALNVVETALITISATAGIQVNTRKVWSLSKDKGLARIIVITKLDGENIEVNTLLKSIKEELGPECFPFDLPIEYGHNFKGVVNLLEPPKEIPKGVLGDPKTSREALIEAVVEVDDALMQRYLEGKEISIQEIQDCLTKAIAQGKLV